MDDAFAAARGTEALARRQLAGRYRVGARLGGGGMAIVHQATDERLHRPVAVKILDSTRGADAVMRARFEAEARAAASISHPNVVAVHDVGVEGDVLFIVMECLPGRTLGDELRTGPMTEDRLRSILEDVLAGLAAAHAKGLLHRDIKPTNVLLTEDDRAKLADFGIATSTPGDLTQTGVVIGTPAYLAPERVAGQRATVQSDVYAVAVLAYEALAGMRPFTGDSPLALAHAIHGGRAPSLGDLRPDVSASLCDLVARAMAVDPGTRPATAREFARLLDSSARGLPLPEGRPTEHATPTVPAAHVPHDRTSRIPAAPPDSGPASGSRPRRGPRLAIVVAVSIALIIAVVGVWSLSRDDSEPTDATPGETSVPAPSVPAPLDEPFDRLEEAVQP